MIKQVILLFNLIGIIIFNTLLIDVSVQQQLQETANVNEEVIVKISINKSNLSGFAKIQQQIPQGFSVEKIETKGATFSFKDNTLKFIWMALPNEEEFTISYKIIASEKTLGTFNFEGKFAYIDENERKIVPIPAKSLTIINDDNDLTSTPNNEENNMDNTVVETTPDVEGVEEIEKELIPSVTSSKKVTPLENNTYQIDLTIIPTDIEGFAKVEEIIPEGLAASSNNKNEDAKFSFKDNKVKFLWMSFPKKDTLKLSYIINSVQNETKNYTINGSFSFLKEESTEKHIFNSVEINTTKEDDDEITETELAEETTETTTEEQPIETSNTQNKETEVVSTPTAETGVTYKVQIGAGRKEVPTSYFDTKFNVKDNINIETHEGWVKYVVGSYKVYKAARDKRNKIWATNNINGAFVTAYNQGNRILVQEALMISNQKWYK